MTTLIVLSPLQAKGLIAYAIASRLKKSSQRVYFSYGSTNELILKEMGIECDNYYNGCVVNNKLHSNKSRPNIVVLNNNLDESFVDTINNDDIILKGANALCYKDNGKYKAAVAIASPNGGTYTNIFVKSKCVGAKVIIPISHEKLVPMLYTQYSQNSFDVQDGLGIALFELDYGEIYTEIEAFKESFNLEAKLYIAGGINDMVASTTFIVEGSLQNIEVLKLKIEEFKL